MSRRLSPLLPLLLVLAGCNLGAFGIRKPPVRVLRLAALLPASGVDGTLGKAIRRGVALAVRQNVKPAKGYRLKLTDLNESGLSASELRRVLREQRVLGIVGPLESSSASILLPEIERRGIPTISLISPVSDPPTATTVFPLGVPIQAAGKVAADLATAPGLAAQTVFLVDDGTPYGKTLGDAFAAEVASKGGTIAGRDSISPADPIGTQRVVSAIVAAEPNLVFYAGATVAGAELRRILSQTGAPLLPMLTAGPIADHPDWVAAVGGRAIAAHTLAILPAPALGAFPHIRRFERIYRRAYPSRALLSQTVLAYDATRDEIRAIKELIHAGKPVTRRAVATLIARQPYRGVSGLLVFDRPGSNSPVRFSLYTIGTDGVWHYQRAVS